MATASVSSLLLGAVPAVAAAGFTDACGASGTLSGVGVCEEVVTSGSTTFTTTTQMTQLVALLVGVGVGSGGEVKIVDFSGATSPLAIDVAEGAAHRDSGASGRVPDSSSLPAAVDAVGTERYLSS